MATRSTGMSRMQRWSFIVQTGRWQGWHGTAVLVCTVAASPCRLVPLARTERRPRRGLGLSPPQAAAVLPARGDCKGIPPIDFIEPEKCTARHFEFQKRVIDTGIAVSAFLSMADEQFQYWIGR